MTTAKLRTIINELNQCSHFLWPQSSDHPQPESPNSLSFILNSSVRHPSTQGWQQRHRVNAVKHSPSFTSPEACSTLQRLGRVQAHMLAQRQLSFSQRTVCVVLPNGRDFYFIFFHFIYFIDISSPRLNEGPSPKMSVITIKLCCDLILLIKSVNWGSSLQ